MTFLNKSSWLEGVISEISNSGLKFRPAKTYIPDKRGTQVLFEFANFRITGKIVATRVDGYGIALLEELEDAKIKNFLEEYANNGNNLQNNHVQQARQRALLDEFQSIK